MNLTATANQSKNQTESTASSKKQNSSTYAGKPCLQLKGSLVPMTVLELTYFESAQFKADLNDKISQAPDFFENLPIVIGLEKLDTSESIDFEQLVKDCEEVSINVVAVRGGSELQQNTAKQAGLGLLAKQKTRAEAESAPLEVPEVVEAKVETVEIVKTVIQNTRQQSKIVHHPIRSGQQVYAADGDLIILASVSAGAEILADGNIHVYGALRGRALAGVKGDTNARIFCHSLEAELVSVAGQYKVSDDFDKSLVRKSSQIFLNDQKLCFKSLEL